MELELDEEVDELAVELHGVDVDAGGVTPVIHDEEAGAVTPVSQWLDAGREESGTGTPVIQLSGGLVGYGLVAPVRVVGSVDSVTYCVTVLMEQESPS